MIPVVLSGGSGTRLWPVSRTKYPKQFCDLFEESLQTMTLKRLAKWGDPWIITGQVLRDFTEKKAIEAGVKPAFVAYEPIAKNTAPAVALACRVAELKGLTQEVLGVFPADHLVEKTDVFHETLQLAVEAAKKGKVVTIGLKPKSPETGYGYIQTSKRPSSEVGGRYATFPVLRFHEKPTHELALQFLADGSFYWNAGIFVFSVAKMIELFRDYQPQIWATLSELKADLSNLKAVYEKLPSISVDYAIMEKLGAEDLFCVPCDPGWSDVGSWDAVATVYNRTGVKAGNTIEVDSRGNFVLPHRDKTYALVGVENLVIVDTADALLVSLKGHSQDVKTVVERIKKETPKLANEHVFEERPWGRFEILRDDNHYKSKIIRVNPGAQLSYQSHEKREEHWILIRGTGEVVLNDQIVQVKKGTHVHIPMGAKHRIRNTGSEPIEFIEVQLGTYFGEDDIKRYSDDYGRLET